MDSFFREIATIEMIIVPKRGVEFFYGEEKEDTLNSRSNTAHKGFEPVDQEGPPVCRKPKKNPKGPRASTMSQLTFVGCLSMASEGSRSDLPNATRTHGIRSSRD